MPSSSLLARNIATPQVVSWHTFCNQFRWVQGEHLSILGPTGGGKTTLATALLPMRNYVVAVATKPRDESLERLERGGYVRITEWPPPVPPSEAPRLIFWPTELSKLASSELADDYMDLMEAVYQDGDWTLYLDEVVFLADILSLERTLRMLWTQSRSVNVTIVATTQRPARVPLEMYSQAKHMFFFKHSEKDDIRRVSDMGAANAEIIRQTLPRLRPHQFLYVNTTTGTMVRSKVHVPPTNGRG